MTPAGSTQNGKPLDLVVVGAGVIGLAVAWRAAERGLAVRVIERRCPGAGASGVAAGMLAPVGEASWGEEPMVRAALESHQMWPDFAEELGEVAGADPGLDRSGALHVALDADEASELRRRFELMESLGLEASWLRGRSTRTAEPGLGPAAFAGIDAPAEAAVDPQVLIAALHDACAVVGVDIAEGADVNGVLVEDDSLRGVETADGVRHRAGTTVLAAGAWSGNAEWLPREAVPPVRPVKGQIVTLSASAGESPIGRIIVTERVYMVPRSDGSLVVGATVEELGFDNRVTAGGVLELLREAYRAVPDIAELELTRATAGLRPGTPDNAPLVGPAPLDGLVWATGHYRNGILLAPLTAEAVVAGILGEEAPVAARAMDPGRIQAGIS